MRPITSIAFLSGMGRDISVKNRFADKLFTAIGIMTSEWFVRAVNCTVVSLKSLSTGIFFVTMSPFSVKEAII
jgi:hypothetical protein